MPNARGPAGQHGTRSFLPRWTTTPITLCGACSALDSVHSCAPYYQMVPEPNHRTPVLRANGMSLLITIKWGETLPHMRRWCQWHESTWLFRLTGVQVEGETHRDTFCSISFLSWLDESEEEKQGDKTGDLGAMSMPLFTDFTGERNMGSAVFPRLPL